MDYAVTLLVPILLGLLLGNWLTQTFHISSLWTLLLAVLGMVGGIGIMYKRFVYGHPLKKITPKPPQEPGTEHKDLNFLYKDYDDDGKDDLDEYDKD